MKMTKEYLGDYYIAKSPQLRRQAAHNIASWQKNVSLAESKPDGVMTFDELSTAVKNHEHGTDGNSSLRYS